MSITPIPPVDSIDKTQWQPHEQALCFHYVNFARLANSVVTEEGPLRGWFSEALWRQYSYAPFNARVMENYHSLAFFYAYDAPWNPYYRSPEVLLRLRYALEYTFGLMGDNGAIPEYAPADLDTPMLAPSSFGMEYMASALEYAGPLLPDDLRARLAAQARKAALYVLTSEESWEHARAFTNQFLGALAGGSRLARVTRDDALKAHVAQGMEALLDETRFMSPMGYLYEANGPETFAYFFTTLSRLIPLFHELRDSRVLEVLRRHCAWMARWMLLEPDGDTVLLAGAHQTRTGDHYRIQPRGIAGAGALLEGEDDERRFLKLFAQSAEQVAITLKWWEAEPDLVAHYRAEGLHQGYRPVPIHSRYAPYAPPEAEIAAARRALPCLDPTPRCETQHDERGNQYVLLRQPAYYAGLGFSTRRTKALHGPNFLWHATGGTLILSQNGEGPCWETVVGEKGTGTALSLATVREGRGGWEVLLRYEDLGFSKTYVLRPGEIDVLIGTRAVAGQALSERIPLLLRETDQIVLDYGRCPAGGIGSRPLGVVTRVLGIERDGKRLLTLDLGAPTSGSLAPDYDADGYVRVELRFVLPAAYFGRTGYQVTIS